MDKSASFRLQDCRLSVSVHLQGKVLLALEKTSSSNILMKGPAGNLLVVVIQFD